MARPSNNSSAEKAKIKAAAERDKAAAKLKAEKQKAKDERKKEHQKSKDETKNKRAADPNIRTQEKGKTKRTGMRATAAGGAVTAYIANGDRNTNSFSSQLNNDDKGKASNPDTSGTDSGNNQSGGSFNA